MSDRLECGCYWTSYPDGIEVEPGVVEPGVVVRGDVLHQCEAHKNGAKYPGSNPPTNEELRKLVETLEGGGLRTKVIK